jgi:hypothetical protein
MTKAMKSLKEADKDGKRVWYFVRASSEELKVEKRQRKMLPEVSRVKMISNKGPEDSGSSCSSSGRYTLQLLRRDWLQRPACL